jgi:hypothetical protein
MVTFVETNFDGRLRMFYPDALQIYALTTRLDGGREAFLAQRLVKDV